jgi:ubiquitin carboxyl-terminal hydrolase 25
MTTVLGQLALLFNQLEYSENPSVTPSMELAKLALTTSLDDEQDEIDRGGTASSNDTDATLVDDAPLRSRQLPSSPSVLGKRNRSLTKEDAPPPDDPMGEETQEVGSPTSVSSTNAVAGPSNPPSEGGKAEPDAPEASAAPASSKSLKPPAAARKTSGTTMMFGVLSVLIVSFCHYLIL